MRPSYEQQWKWVVANRRPPARLLRLSEAAAGWLRGQSGGEYARLTRVAGLLADRTDAAFRTHCTVGSLRGGVLTLWVDRESMVHPMRLAWWQLLREMLHGQRGLRIRDIRFVPGRGGVAVAAPAAAAPSAEDELRASDGSSMTGSRPSDGSEEAVED